VIYLGKIELIKKDIGKKNRLSILTIAFYTYLLLWLLDNPPLLEDGWENNVELSNLYQQATQMVEAFNKACYLEHSCEIIYRRMLIGYG